MDRRQFFTLSGLGVAGFAIDGRTTIYGYERFKIFCGGGSRVQRELSLLTQYERITTTKLMQDMVDAIRENRLREFRQILREKKYLIIEHVHRLKHRHGTTMELVELIESRPKELPPLILTSYERLGDMKRNEEYLIDLRELLNGRHNPN